MIFFRMRLKFLKYKKINNFARINSPKIQEFSKSFFPKGFLIKRSLNVSFTICSSTSTIRRESQDMMRYSKYMEIAATKSEIKTESLPSSENTAQQHSFWVYLEVMDWKYLEEAHIDPLEWDWFLCNGLYHPVYTKQLAAPADWLRFVSCKCKLFSKRPCSTNCSCEKNGLYCVAACGNCRGDGRHNENLCELKALARILSNMYFFNLSLKLQLEIVRISCLILLGSSLNILFASSMNVDVFMYLSFAMIIGASFLGALVGFFNSSFKFAGIFSLFIPLYTSFSIDESIRSSGNSHLRSTTSFLHPYLHLTKPAQDCRSFSNLFFDTAVMF